MSDNEKRARDLLAEGLRDSYQDSVAARQVIRQLLADELDFISARVAVKVLIAALTPPEGYVLVPVEATRPMKDAVESFAIPHCYLRTGVQIADFNERYRAMLAARPEVKP